MTEKYRSGLGAEKSDQNIHYKNYHFKAHGLSGHEVIGLKTW